MKRICALMMAVLLSMCCLLTFTGCGAKVDEAAVIARAKELIPQTDMINRLFHIEGLPMRAGAVAVGGYAEVDMNEIEALGYQNLEEILTSMKGIWTEDYIGRFRSSALFEAVGNGNTQESKYCYDQYNIKTDAYEGIWVSVKGLDNPTDPVEYLYDTLAVDKIYNANQVRLSMQVVVTDSEHPTETQQTEITITLARENKKAAWLLDSSVVVKYYKEEA